MNSVLPKKKYNLCQQNGMGTIKLQHATSGSIEVYFDDLWLGSFPKSVLQDFLEQEGEDHPTFLLQDLVKQIDRLSYGKKNL